MEMKSKCEQTSIFIIHNSSILRENILKRSYMVQIPFQIDYMQHYTLNTLFLILR